MSFGGRPDFSVVARGAAACERSFSSCRCFLMLDTLVVLEPRRHQP